MESLLLSALGSLSLARYEGFVSQRSLSPIARDVSLHQPFSASVVHATHLAYAWRADQRYWEVLQERHLFTLGIS